VDPAEPGAEPAEPVEEPLPPHHQEAYDAIAEGDFETAIREYTTAIAQDPRDQLAVDIALTALLSELNQRELVSPRVHSTRNGASSVNLVPVSRPWGWESVPWRRR
jgi:hypothetical protein